MRKACTLLIFFLVMILAGENESVAQSSVFQKWKTRKIEKKVAGKNRRAPAEKKIKESRSVRKAKKEQEKKQARLKREQEKALSENRSRHFKIQSGAVKERMKKNEKEVKARDKARRKALRKAGRKARKKYKK